MRPVTQAGKRPLSIDELVRLQHIVIENHRFTNSGRLDTATDVLGAPVVEGLDSLEGRRSAKLWRHAVGSARE
jgi:hypothetical protein